ncbi:MAG: hypothetical protein AAF304_02675 [Pseudomonadota bacterium]
MKADLVKYKNYTILYKAKETASGEYVPVATLFKSNEEAVTLNIERKFTERNAALSYALGAAEETVDAKIKGKKPDFTLLVGEQMR